MHEIRTTKGLVIQSAPYKEAGKLFTIFTKDMGLVSALAEGIRLEKSKLRYNLEEYSLGSFSMVKGKEFWRITNAETTDIINSSIKDNQEDNLISREKLRLVAKICLLLKRLLHYEQSEPRLFDLIEDFVLFLKDGSISRDGLISLETIIVYRIMYWLGYIDQSLLHKDIMDAPFDIEVIKRAEGLRKEINGQINRALKESQM